MSFRCYITSSFLPFISFTTMTAIKVVTILILLTYIGFVLAQTINKRGLCGRTLAEAMAKYCEANGMSVKRSETDKRRYGGVISWPWLGTQRALSFGRSKREIVEECCYKTCKIETLMTYCQQK